MLVLLVGLVGVGWGCVTRGSKENLSNAAAARPAEPEQRMSIAQVTPEEAKRLLDRDGFLYLDVRTVPEFVNGHPPSALNIPVAEINPQTGRMEINEKFLGVVAANISPDAQLLVGCKTGGRSATACEMLAQAGYKNLRNVVGGFAGVTDPSGQVVQEGWSTLGYPIERGDGGAKGYSSLAAGPKR
jgi:rhodanese-related sulfurtransferase